MTVHMTIHMTLHLTQLGDQTLDITLNIRQHQCNSNWCCLFSSRQQPITQQGDLNSNGDFIMTCHQCAITVVVYNHKERQWRQTHMGQTKV